MFVVCEKHMVQSYVSHGHQHIPGIPRYIGRTQQPRDKDIHTLPVTQ